MSSPGHRRYVCRMRRRGETFVFSTHYNHCQARMAPATEQRRRPCDSLVYPVLCVFPTDAAFCLFVCGAFPLPSPLRTSLLSCSSCLPACLFFFLFFPSQVSPPHPPRCVPPGAETAHLRLAVQLHHHRGRLALQLEEADVRQLVQPGMRPTGRPTVPCRAMPCPQDTDGGVFAG